MYKNNILTIYGYYRNAFPETVPKVPGAINFVDNEKMHKDVIKFDVISSYPSSILLHNISPENVVEGTAIDLY